MNRLLAALSSFGGIATRRQLMRCGFTGYELTAAVRSGHIARIRQGYYCTDETFAGAAAAVRVGGLLGCVSAASAHGVWAGTDSRTHMVVPWNASRLRSRKVSFADSTDITPDTSSDRIVLHWVQQTRPSVRGTAPCWVVPLSESLLQLAQCADTETSIAAWETALEGRHISSSELDALRGRLPDSVRQMLSDVTFGSGSGVESIAKQRLQAAGLSAQQQVFVEGVGRVDLLVEGRVIVEIDGFAYHSSPEQFERDRRRDALLTAAGYVVIRLSYRQVMEDWAFCRRSILHALATH